MFSHLWYWLYIFFFQFPIAVLENICFILQKVVSQFPVSVNKWYKQFSTWNVNFITAFLTILEWHLSFMNIINVLDYRFSFPYQQIPPTCVRTLLESSVVLCLCLHPTAHNHLSSRTTVTASENRVQKLNRHMNNFYMNQDYVFSWNLCKRRLLKFQFSTSTRQGTYLFLHKWVS